MQNKNLNKIWIIGAIGLVVIAFIVLFSGVVAGIGQGYENPEASFDFAPYGHAFNIVNGINIIFNIVMIIIKKKTNKKVEA